MPNYAKGTRPLKYGENPRYLLLFKTHGIIYEFNIAFGTKAIIQPRTKPMLYNPAHKKCKLESIKCNGFV